MTDRARSRISVDDEDGRHVAAADIEVMAPSEVRASLHVESGHLPVGTRTRLVDAVLDTPEVSSCEHVQVALPLGDTEILDRVRERCDTEEGVGGVEPVTAEFTDTYQPQPFGSAVPMNFAVTLP